MNYKSLFNNFIFAIIAQGSGLLLGIVTSLIVPKVLSIEDFGYWQLFLFYCSYVGFFHFGINDGIYLIKGGQSRNTIDKKDVISQFYFSIVFQSFISLLIGIFTLYMSLNQEREFVLITVLLFLVICNSTSFLGYIFQAMNETKTYSLSIIVNQLIFLLILLLMLFSNITDYHFYIYGYLFSKACSLLYCLIKGKDLFKTELLPFPRAATNSFQTIRVGIKLMIANIASTLIFGIVRFSVDIIWGIETFGQLSLAISLMSFVLTFISQIGMVLFPALRQTNQKETDKVIEKIRDLSFLLFPFVYVVFIPIALFIDFWLPNYSLVTSWLALLLPACVFDGKMNICFTTYFKVMRKEKDLLLINVGTVLVSTIGVLISVLLISSPEMAILSGVIAVVIRSVYSEIKVAKLVDFKNKYKVDDIILTIVFLITINFFDYFWSELICVLCFFVFLIKNKSLLKSFITLFSNKFTK